MNDEQKELIEAIKDYNQALEELHRELPRVIGNTIAAWTEFIKASKPWLEDINEVEKRSKGNRKK